MVAYWETAAHSDYDMFSKYKYLIVNLGFPHFGFWSRNFFLIAPFPDHCLLLPFYRMGLGPLSMRSHFQIQISPRLAGL